LRLEGPWTAAAALVLITLLAYLPALRAGFIWDDNALTENPLLGSLRGLGRIWTTPSAIPNESHYWPLTYTSFWLEDRLWGLRPLGYHLDNVLLHAGAGVLCWRVLRRLRVPGAWLGAALFALHPQHVESVAWVIERKDVLCAVFYLSAALAWLEFNAGGRWGWNLAALGLLGAALLSKSSAVSWPLAMLLALAWRHGRPRRRDLWPLLPAAALTVGVTLADLALYRQAAGESAPALTLLARVLIAAHGLAFYAGKLLWPLRLATLYPQWEANPASGGAWLVPLATFGAVVLFWHYRKKIGGGSLAALLFFALALAPALGLVPFGFMRFTFVADRFIYLASIGPLALLAAGGAVVAERRQWPAAARRAGVALALALLAGLTWRQAAFYRTTETLFRHNIEVYPACWAAHYELGGALAGQGKNKEAAAAFGEALRLNPHFARAHHDLGVALGQLGQSAQAELHFREALRLKAAYPEAMINLGALVARQGRLGEAVSLYRAALRLWPDSGQALNNLGNVLVRQRKLPEAVEVFTQALRLHPAQAGLETNLASALAESGRPDAAIAHYGAAIRLDPRYFAAQANLGILLLRENRADEAIGALEAALRLNPKAPFVHYHLGDACARRRRWAEAERHLNETLRLNPAYPGAAQKLAEVRAAEKYK